MWRNTENAYGRLTRWLHWSIVVLFLAQILLGFLTQALAAHPVVQFSVYQWHKSLGLLVLGLALLRLAWAMANIRPSPATGVRRLEAIGADVVHRTLLLLTVLVPLAGWAVVSASPLGIPVYVFDFFAMPNIPLAVSDQDEAFWSRIHAVLAYSAAILVVVHAVAALYHHVMRGDDTLRRMMGIQPRQTDDAG